MRVRRECLDISPAYVGRLLVRGAGCWVPRAHQHTKSAPTRRVVANALGATGCALCVRCPAAAELAALRRALNRTSRLQRHLRSSPERATRLSGRPCCIAVSPTCSRHDPAQSKRAAPQTTRAVAVDSRPVLGGARRPRALAARLAAADAAARRLVARRSLVGCHRRTQRARHSRLVSAIAPRSAPAHALAGGGRCVSGRDRRRAPPARLPHAGSGRSARRREGPAGSGRAAQADTLAVSLEASRWRRAALMRPQRGRRDPPSARAASAASGPPDKPASP